jgi:hypothetical protein
MARTHGIGDDMPPAQLTEEAGEERPRNRRGKRISERKRCCWTALYEPPREGVGRQYPVLSGKACVRRKQLDRCVGQERLEFLASDRFAFECEHDVTRHEVHSRCGSELDRSVHIQVDQSP